MPRVASGADCIGHRGTRAPTYTNGWTQAHLEQKTADKNVKLTKLY